jgi:hypothetical protein
MNDSWLSNLEATNWLKCILYQIFVVYFIDIAVLLSAAVDVTKRIVDGFSVLIHCSDGWDRTSQVSSLAQLMLDPYYRTLKGMQILVEKEWLSFGHKFSERCGLDGKENEKSPIFLQWYV